MTKQELQDQLQTDAITAIGDQYNVGLDVVTGGGKTLLGLKHMAKQFTEDSMFLVAATKKSIFDEWINQAKQHGYEFLLSRIHFTTYISLKKQPYHYNWVYLDECHGLKFTHATWLDMYKMTGGRVLGLSGTFPSSGEKGQMCDLYCQKVFTMDMNDAIEKGMLNNYRIFVHMLKLNTKRVLKQTSSKGKVYYTSESADYHFWNDLIDEETNFVKRSRLRITRMKKIQAYTTKTEYVKHILNKIDYKTLIFATSMAQAEELCKHTYHSKNKQSINDENLAKFDQDLIYRMACVDQISEGKSIKNLKVGIIMHAYANDRQTRQKIGRFVRLNPNETATIHILCYEDTIDLYWVQSALKSFDQAKIKIFRNTKLS